MQHTFNGPLFDLKETVDLRQLTNDTIKSVLPSAVERKSFIINEIPKNILLTADKDLISIILTNLLSNTIKSSTDSCIRISAKQEYGETIITVKDNNSDYSRYISGKMTKVQPIVKKLGGDLRFEFRKQRNITILLSFMNHNMVA